jgi:hypothetical protein
LLAILLAIVAAADSGASGIPAVHVRVDRDASLPCPAGAALAHAVHARLPRVRIVEDGPPEGGDLGASLTPNGEGWRLELERSDGSVVLQRQLGESRGDCSDVADTSSMIIERHLIDIEWPGAPVTIDPLATPVETTQARPEIPKPASPWIDLPTIEAGGSGRLGIPIELAPGLSLEVAARILSTLRVSLWAYWGTATSIPFAVGGNSPVGGSLWLQTLFGAATASLCGSIRSASTCAGGLIGAAVAISGATPTADQTVYSPKRRARALPAAGALARIAQPLPWHFEIALEGSVIVPIGQAAFEIYEAPPQTPPRIATATVDGLVSLRLGCSF